VAYVQTGSVAAIWLVVDTTSSSTCATDRSRITLLQSAGRRGRLRRARSEPARAATALPGRDSRAIRTPSGGDPRERRRPHRTGSGRNPCCG